MASAAKRADRANEDFTGATTAAAVLVDGAGIAGAEATCRHGVAWYATRLGGSLLGLLASEPAAELTAVLAAGIAQVTDAHRGTCDVAAVISPSASVAILRVADGHADYLVLGDAFVVLDGGVLDGGDGAPLVVTDPREVIISESYRPAVEAAVEGSAAYHSALRNLRAHRNRPGGFWVAKDDPRAADEAVTGRVTTAGLIAAALLSNGAARIVEPLRLAGWPHVMAALASAGPADLIRRVRRAEAQHPMAPDDATVTYCTGLGDP